MSKDRYTDLLIVLIRKDTSHLRSYFSAQTPLGPRQAENHHFPVETLHDGGGIMKLLGVESHRSHSEDTCLCLCVLICMHYVCICLCVSICVSVCMCGMSCICVPVCLGRYVKPSCLHVEIFTLKLE